MTIYTNCAVQLLPSQNIGALILFENRNSVNRNYI